MPQRLLNLRNALDHWVFRRGEPREESVPRRARCCTRLLVMGRLDAQARHLDRDIVGGGVAGASLKHLTASRPHIRDGRTPADPTPTSLSTLPVGSSSPNPTSPPPGRLRPPGRLQRSTSWNHSHYGWDALRIQRVAAVTSLESRRDPAPGGSSRFGRHALGPWFRDPE